MRTSFFSRTWRCVWAQIPLKWFHRPVDLQPPTAISHGLYIWAVCGRWPHHPEEPCVEHGAAPAGAGGGQILRPGCVGGMQQPVGVWTISFVFWSSQFIFWAPCEGCWTCSGSRLVWATISPARLLIYFMKMCLRTPYYHFVSLTELQLDFDNMGLSIVVPWSLPEDPQDNMSESMAKMGQIFKEKVREKN